MTLRSARAPRLAGSRRALLVTSVLRAGGAAVGLRRAVLPTRARLVMVRGP